MTVTNEKNLLMLCNQIHKTNNQLQRGIIGKSRRKQKSGATVRSRRTKKRAIEAAAIVDALANVNNVETLTVDGGANAVHGIMASTRITSPMKGDKQGKSLKNATEGRNSVSDSETAVNLANNGT